MSGVKERRKPWIKWRPQAWRSDLRLRSCCVPARGIWIDLLNLMADETDRFGFLLIRGRQPTARQIAAIIGGTSEREVAQLLGELADNGVYSRVGDGDLTGELQSLIPDEVPMGTIFSRRMIRDKARDELDASNGGRGGNPTLKGGVNPKPNERVGDGVNPGVGDRDKVTRAGEPEPRTRTRTKNQESPQPPKGAGGDDSISVRASPGEQPNSEPELLPAEAESDLDIPAATARGEVGEALRAWNAMAERNGLPAVAKLTTERRRKLELRMAEVGGLEPLKRAVGQVPANRFNLGENDRGWKANIDWFLKAGKALSLLESAPKSNGNGMAHADLTEAQSSAFLKANEAYEAGDRKGPRPTRAQFSTWKPGDPISGPPA